MADYRLLVQGYYQARDGDPRKGDTYSATSFDALFGYVTSDKTKAQAWMEEARRQGWPGARVVTYFRRNGELRTKIHFEYTTVPE